MAQGWVSYQGQIIILRQLFSSSQASRVSSRMWTWFYWRGKWRRGFYDTARGCFAPRWEKMFLKKKSRKRLVEGSDKALASAMDKDLTPKGTRIAVSASSDLSGGFLHDAPQGQGHATAKKKSRKPSCSSSSSSSSAQDISAHRDHNNQKRGRSEDGNNQRRGHATAKKTSRKSSCSSSSSSSSYATAKKKSRKSSSSSSSSSSGPVHTHSFLTMAQKEELSTTRPPRRLLKWLLEELGPRLSIPRKREEQWELLWPMLTQLRGRHLLNKAQTKCTRPPLKFSSKDKNIMQGIVCRRMKWLLEELGGPHRSPPRKREAQWEVLWPMLKRLRGRDLREQKWSLSMTRDL